LAAQGWKPGDYLGAENANHADHYTAANASHIRVMLREDNLGLGAQIGRGNAETFGLSMFSGLLGRLNGKSDVESEAQQKARRDAEVRILHEQRYGHMNFISGGFLVGDKMEEKSDLALTGTSPVRPAKRKRSNDPEHGTGGQSGEKEPTTTNTHETTQQNSTATGSLSPSEDSDSDAEEVEEDPLNEAVKTNAGKKHRKKSSISEQESDPGDNKAQKALEKAERRARKDERRKRKDEKRERKALKEKKKAERSVPQASEPPAAMIASAVISNGSRHATRQRYIQQKRMASMDPKALKEIFMLQAAS
jgi:Pin2-interacting protein X1